MASLLQKYINDEFGKGNFYMKDYVLQLYSNFTPIAFNVLLISAV